MKKFMMIAAFAALMLASCTSKPDPVRDAIREDILQMDGGFISVNFTSLEKVDSSTFAQELERKVRTFELKKESDEKFFMKYTQEKKTKNAELKRASFVNDLYTLAALDSLKGVLTPVLDDIAYYVYKFSAEAKGESSSTSFKDAFAAVTPSNEVLGIASKFSDLSKRLGKVIPGYVDLFTPELFMELEAE